MPLVSKGTLRDTYKNIPQLSPPFILEAFSVHGWKELSAFHKKIMAVLLRFVRNISPIFERIGVRKSLNKMLKKRHFDTIVACQESNTTKYLSYCDFPNKIAWIRCDYQRYWIDKGKKSEFFYDQYKAIVCVANKTFENFKKIYPKYTSKTYCIPNPQNSELIIQQAEQNELEPRFLNDLFCIVSIGRLDPIKRFDQIAPIAKQLCAKGLKFRWYLIGDGAEKSNIEYSIYQNGMESVVHILGIKTNPYYYIKKADLYVCLSSSEACPRVVNEAKILGTPTVSTNFSTINEFIENEKTGIIASIEDIPSAISKMMLDNSLYKNIKKEIQSFSFDNSLLLENIEALL